MHALITDVTSNFPARLGAKSSSGADWLHSLCQETSSLQMVSLNSQWRWVREDCKDRPRHPLLLHPYTGTVGVPQKSCCLRLLTTLKPK